MIKIVKTIIKETIKLKIIMKETLKLIYKLSIHTVKLAKSLLHYLSSTKYKSLTAPEESLDALLNDQGFYDSLFKDYLVDGIDFKLKILAHKDYKDFIENESYKVVDNVVNAICEKIPFEVKSVLRHKKASICIRDIKSIRKLVSSIKALGAYYPDSYTIEVGLCETEETINTLYHELGHFIDNVIQDKYSSYVSGTLLYSEIHKETAKAFKEEAHLFRSYAETEISEYIAVAFEEYFKDSDLLYHAPLTKELLDNYMERLRILYCDYIADELYDTEFQEEQEGVCETA